MHHPPAWTALMAVGMGLLAKLLDVVDAKYHGCPQKTDESYVRMPNAGTRIAGSGGDR